MIRPQRADSIIEASVMELLQEKSIEKITVIEIADNCGLSTRTFYNHFLDKHDVVNQIYRKRMEAHINDSLSDWNEAKAEFCISSLDFFKNTIFYTGQNNLLDAMIDLERKKYMLHVKPEARQSPELLQQVTFAINYMIYGNFGLLRDSYRGIISITEEEYANLYKNTWTMMQSLLPQIVLDNLDLYPI